tara:strand:- start:345 stop:1178 length:834 start_codon:yes stop_codon:yes gene_type:complete
MSLEELVKEIQRKIGRNLMRYQQLEQMLKYVVANAQFSGYISELKETIANKKESVKTQTMGQLIGQFVERTDPALPDTSNEYLDRNEAHFAFDFKSVVDEKYYLEKKERLSTLVSERNNLVHHLFPDLDLNSFDSCKEYDTKLDIEGEKVRIEFENTQIIAKSLHDMKNELAQYLMSEEGIKAFMLSFLRQKRLVILLADIAAQTKRDDGWTVMSSAAQLIKQHASDELASLHKGVEYKSLKSLMLKTQMFDFTEEPTKKGGVRVLYRLKESYEVLH